jgi:uncharacterized integral membrane protein (TIGR00697 family)
VHYPLEIIGLHTTPGAFTYPLIFVVTDLTTRLLGPRVARQVVMWSMLPGLLISYLITSSFDTSTALLWGLPEVPLRVAFASFSAYVVGQLLDISIFSHVRRNASWWLAPTLATGIANCVDTAIFFTIAFYGCSNPYLREYWVSIATVDLAVKCFITLIAFLPLYGLVLRTLMPANAKPT